VPIEIISKIILRHANLSTTERYLGKISDVEAMKWIDNLYGEPEGVRVKPITFSP
jgi:integrase/recombinase XerD